MAKTKLSKGQQNFLKDFFNTDYQVAEAQEKSRTVVNRFSGEEIKTSPIVALLISFVYGVERSFGNVSRLKAINSKLTVGNAVQKFDMARMTVLALDEKAYSKILD